MSMIKFLEAETQILDVAMARQAVAPLDSEYVALNNEEVENGALDHDLLAKFVWQECGAAPTVNEALARVKEAIAELNSVEANLMRRL
jgi:hypothetical protein